LKAQEARPEPYHCPSLPPEENFQAIMQGRGNWGGAHQCSRAEETGESPGRCKWLESNLPETLRTDRIISSSFHESSLILIPKPIKGITRKRYYRPSLSNTDVKS